MTPAGNGGGCDKKKANLRANSIDFADREESGGKKKLCRRHIWRPPNFVFAPYLFTSQSLPYVSAQVVTNHERDARLLFVKRAHGVAELNQFLHG